LRIPTDRVEVRRWIEAWRTRILARRRPSQHADLYGKYAKSFDKRSLKLRSLGSARVSAADSRFAYAR